jgi:hypothetical protein
MANFEQFPGQRTSDAFFTPAFRSTSSGCLSRASLFLREAGMLTGARKSFSTSINSARLVESANALDSVLFLNGLPVITFELKNQLTKQTVDDAVDQYKRDRDAKELLFHFGRCMVHFAVDDKRVKMCTHLRDGASWFLPFDKGWNDGAGNPPNPDGIRIVLRNSKS